MTARRPFVKDERRAPLCTGSGNRVPREKIDPVLTERAGSKVRSGLTSAWKMASRPACVVWGQRRSSAAPWHHVTSLALYEPRIAREIGGLRRRCPSVPSGRSRAADAPDGARASRRAGTVMRRPSQFTAIFSAPPLEQNPIRADYWPNQSTGEQECRKVPPIRPCSIRAQTRMPLNGITVLDLTLARAGPTAVRHFADWGANVIRIEPPASDGEDVAGRRHGFDFQNLHRNKRAITLNLKTPEGHAAFMRLAKTADVVLENMRADVKHRLKVSYDDVKAVNPRIVYGTISGFGQDGPYGPRAGVDQIAQGMGGLMSITGIARPGAGARRHSDRRPDRRQPAGARLHDGAVRPGAHRRRPLGHHQPAGSADLHARLPGQPLADREGGRRPGRQRPPDRHPDRRVPDQRRPHQHRGQFVARVHPVLRGDRQARTGWRTRNGRPRSAAASIARRSTPRSARSPRRSRPNTGSSCSRPTAFPAGRSTRSTRCSPIRR